MANTGDRTQLRRWWDLPSALLLFAAILTATVRLTTTEWTENLDIAQYLAFIGLMLGLLLGQSVFSSRVTTLIAAIYGLFFIPWQFGLLMNEGILWSERLLSLYGRLSTSILQLIQRRPVTDPILFLFLMSILFWMLSLSAGYHLTRHAHPWMASLPIGIALFIIHIHDPYWPYRTWYVATYIFFSLLLLARVTYLHHHASWQRTHTRLPPYLGLDLIRTTLFATVTIVLLAWTVPALANSVPLAERAWQRVSRPWVIARSRMSNAFASLRASVGLVYDYYGDVLPLGRGNELTNDILLTVNAPERPDTVVRYYWRAKVYDTYEAGLWTGNFDETRPLSPQNFAVELSEFDGRWSTTVDITTWIPLSTLFTLPQPEWVSRPVRADLIDHADGTVDIGAFHAQTNIRPGETYQIQASLSNATVKDLRAAGTDYPDHVTERYLQLPDNITPRTYELAANLEAGHDNPYDKVVAVTNYLRENIEYSDTVPIPPSDQDPVDWVLFDLKRGFCNYYATSEIVLLRAMGIPARWAVGYAQGEFDSETDTYIVRQREAHSWPEVYFPDIGWVEFEPTLSQPAIDRQIGEGEGEIDPAASTRPDRSDFENIEDPLGPEAGFLNPEDTTVSDEDPVIPLLAALAAIALVLIATFAWRRRPAVIRKPLPILLETGLNRVGVSPPKTLRKWAQSARASSLARAYNEVNKALLRLGTPPRAHDTPAERAAVLVGILPAASEPVQLLLGEYHITTYGKFGGNAQTARSAARQIRNLSWLARLYRFFTRWQEPRVRTPDRIMHP